MLGEILKFNKDGGDGSVPRCYKCNEKGHLKADCPQLKNEKNALDKGKMTFNRGMLATWSDDEAIELPGSDDDNDVGFKNVTCFMAIGDQVNTLIHPNTDIVMSEDMFDTIEEAYAFDR